MMEIVGQYGVFFCRHTCQTNHISHEICFSPHRGLQRRIREGQMIHSSLLHDDLCKSEPADHSPQHEASEKLYEPRASLKYAGYANLKNWRELQSFRNLESHLLPSFMERDLNDLAHETLKHLRADRPLDNKNVLRQFMFLTSSSMSML